MFVALSRFVVANDTHDAVKRAFVARPHLVDAVPGFVRLEVLSPVDRPAEIWLLTFWEDEPSFRAWHGSATYRATHVGIPKGVKLVPGETELRFLLQVAT